MARIDRISRIDDGAADVLRRDSALRYVGFGLLWTAFPVNPLCGSFLTAVLGDTRVATLVFASCLFAMAVSSFVFGSMRLRNRVVTRRTLLVGCCAAAVILGMLPLAAHMGAPLWLLCGLAALLGPAFTCFALRWFALFTTSHGNGWARVAAGLFACCLLSVVLGIVLAQRLEPTWLKWLVLVGALFGSYGCMRGGERRLDACDAVVSQSPSSQKLSCHPAVPATAMLVGLGATWGLATGLFTLQPAWSTPIFWTIAIVGTALCILIALVMKRSSLFDAFGPDYLIRLCLTFAGLTYAVLPVIAVQFPTVVAPLCTLVMALQGTSISVLLINPHDNTGPDPIELTARHYAVFSLAAACATLVVWPAAGATNQHVLWDVVLLVGAIAVIINIPQLPDAGNTA